MILYDFLRWHEEPYDTAADLPIAGSLQDVHIFLTLLLNLLGLARPAPYTKTELSPAEVVVLEKGYPTAIIYQTFCHLYF